MRAAEKDISVLLNTIDANLKALYNNSSSRYNAAFHLSEIRDIANHLIQLIDMISENEDSEMQKEEVIRRALADIKVELLFHAPSHVKEFLRVLRKLEKISKVG